jgi:cyclohexanone monooxygenase
VALWKANYPEWRRRARHSMAGFPFPASINSALEASPQQRQAVFAAQWEAGGFTFLSGSFNDIVVSEAANKTAADFVRAKIDEIVRDPETAEMLKPREFPIGTKRLPLDTNYYATFNRPNVTLVDLKRTPVEEITPDGIRTSAGHHDLDVIVYATGYDAMTGPIRRIDVRGRGGVSMRDKWADGPHTYLGLMSADFPNFFTICGPQSPSVLSNMPISIEQHVQYIGRIITDMATRGARTIEPTRQAESAWGEHCQELVAPTLFQQADTWYMGANIPGKPRVFMPYLGFVGPYRQRCDEIADKDYEGFVFDGACITEGAWTGPSPVDPKN